MRYNGISTRLWNLRGSFFHSAARSTPSRVLASALFSLGLLASTSALAQVENIQHGYAGADDGDWGGKKGAVIGPADNTCANMGAVGKVNLVSNFGFDIPSDATITEVRAFTKAGAGDEQIVGVQLATNATVDPPVLIGDEVDYPFPDVGAGNCASTVVSDVGNGLGFWGLVSLDPDDVNLPIFGMVFTKQETSEIKVDSICMQIEYETDEGPAVVEECFAPPQPQNSINVVKDVVGAAPGTDWAYSGTLGAFTLPAGGGFELFEALQDGSYTITETTKPGYTVTSECTIDGEVVASGTDSVTVEIADDVMATCIFVNTLNTGTFTVAKDFSDDNASLVPMTLTCSSGTITTNPLNASEGSPAEFEVTGFLPGATCTATEAAIPGYIQDDSACQVGGLLADGGSCTMVNTLRVGTFTVAKDFSDDSDAAVDMTLTCSSGTVTANPLAASEGSPAEFEVTGFLPGATCTATEAATPGYDQDDSACQVGGLLADGGSCTMVNTLRVGTFTVEKLFSDENEAAVDMTLTCTSGDITTNPLPASMASPAEFEVTGFLVGATCTATEAATPGYDQDDSACQVEGLLADGGSCTMVNTLRTGEFTVHKSYSDDNETPVTVTASCTGNGSFDENPLTAAPGDPAVFTYTGFIGDPTCTAVESNVPDGYDSNNDDCQDGDDLNSSCTITNELIAIARFRVTKDFSDDNPQGVMVHITCTTGLPLSESAEIFDKPGDYVEFIVTTYIPGTLNCTITEDPIPDGYTPEYTAALGSDGVAGVDPVGGGESCVFEEVEGGHFTCEIFNQADPATFTVWKEWEIVNTGGDFVIEDAKVTIACYNEIVGGTFDLIEGWWELTGNLGDGESLVATVDTTERSATCWATEQVYQSGVESIGDCSPRDIPAGGSSECTFVNTVFFEGIPTLSQYGLALMALLMLGIGMVGFRRFS
jgi:hypothetical protein